MSGIRSEIKEQQDKLKDMTLKGKISYILYYYKWWIILGIIVFTVLFNEIKIRVCDKPDAFYCIIINASTFDSVPADLLKDYSEYTEINTKKFDIRLDSSYLMDFKNSEPLAYNNVERIDMLINNNELDALICPKDIAYQYLDTGYIDSMVDITQYRTFAKYDLYKGRGPIYYCEIKKAPHPEASAEFQDFLCGDGPFGSPQ